MTRSVRKELLYPIFLEVSQMSTDKYWSCIFEDFAYGTCPLGIGMDQISVYCQFKNNHFNYRFDNKTALEIHTELQNVLREKVGIRSKIDYLNQKNEFFNVLKGVSQTNWKSIKKKHIKEVLIDDYIINMKNLHNLSDVQTTKLINYINIGFYFKFIQPDDIEYDIEKCRIERIKNVDVNGPLTPPVFKQPHNPPLYLPKKACIYELWNKRYNI